MPVFTVRICSHVTRSAESYAILWRCIHLHIVNVVNMITKFVTDFAGIVIAGANHAFEYIIECGWVWCKRNTTAPTWSVFTRCTQIVKPTFCRAKGMLISIGAGEFIGILLSAIKANQINAFQPNFIETMFRAINPFFAISNERPSTMWANILIRSTFPKRGCRSFDCKIMTIARTINSIIMRMPNNKHFTAILANLFNNYFSHSFSLKGAPRTAVGLLFRQSGLIGVHIKNILPTYQTA